jgi:hypothetical protein
MVFSLSIKDVTAVILELCLARFVAVSPWADLKRPKMFSDQATRFGVDVAAIEKKIAAEFRTQKNTKAGAVETKKPETDTKAPKMQPKTAKSKTKAAKQ